MRAGHTAEATVINLRFFISVSTLKYVFELKLGQHLLFNAGQSLRFIEKKIIRKESKYTQKLSKMECSTSFG